MHKAGDICVLFAGGGTGGHLFPAIAVADELKTLAPLTRIEFVGTRRKIESRVVPEKGYAFHTIWISGLHRRLTLGNILFPVKVLISIVQSIVILRTVKPAVVVGTGGYVCGPIVFSAWMMSIPTIIHESNSYPGVTTRILASKATKVFITFEATRRWISPSARCELVGNPTRKNLSSVSREEGCQYFSLDPAKKTVLVFGGSLGAASINRLMPAFLENARREDLQVIWQMGERGAESLRAVDEYPGIRIRRFIENMEFAYAAADLVLCRSGATTLAELMVLGKPAILVPYPHAAANHQELNARTMVDAGAAIMVRDSELHDDVFTTVKNILGDDQRRRTMSEQCRKLGKPNAGAEIAQKILDMVN